MSIAVWTWFLCLVVILPFSIAAPTSSPRAPSPPSAPALPQSPPAGQHRISGKGWAYTLVKELHGSPSGTNTWSLTDKTRIAKQFRTHSVQKEITTAQRLAFARESGLARYALGLYVAGGVAAINGEDFSWLVTPSGKDTDGRGMDLVSRTQFTDRRKKRRECKTYLSRVVRIEFKRYMWQFYKDSEGFVLLDPAPSVTLWDRQAKKIIGILSYNKVDKIEGPLFKEMSSRVIPGSVVGFATLNNVIDVLANTNYPNSLCDQIQPTSGGTFNQLMSFDSAGRS